MIHTEYLSGRDASQRLRDSKQGPAALSRDHDAQTERRTVMPVLRLAAEPVTASDSESVRVRAEHEFGGAAWYVRVTVTVRRS